MLAELVRGTESAGDPIRCDTGTRMGELSHTLFFLARKRKCDAGQSNSLFVTCTCTASVESRLRAFDWPITTSYFRFRFCYARSSQTTVTQLGRCSIALAL